MVSFGEVVLFKLATYKTRRRKLKSEWQRGIVVGMTMRTTEMLIANGGGIFKCRTIRRVPKENMADPRCVEKVMVDVATFLKTGAKTSGCRTTRVIEPMPQAPPTEEPETRRTEIVPRRIRLTPKVSERTDTLQGVQSAGT